MLSDLRRTQRQQNAAGLGEVVIFQYRHRQIHSTLYNVCTVHALHLFIEFYVGDK